MSNAILFLLLQQLGASCGYAGGPRQGTQPHQLQAQFNINLFLEILTLPSIPKPKYSLSFGDSQTTNMKVRVEPSPFSYLSNDIR